MVDRDVSYSAEITSVADVEGELYSVDVVEQPADVSAEGGPPVIEGVADIDVDPFSGTVLPAVNACEGTALLRWQDQPAQPGDACGECGDGVLGCVAADTLTCLGASRRNLCGGCFELLHTPGQVCGACSLGVYECDGKGGVRCEGDREPNDCGGCTVLPSSPATACGTTREPATYLCTGDDELRCIPDNANVCGGRSEIEGTPGTLCGVCGRGVRACQGSDALICSDENAGLNVCGGCTELTAETGEACGDCGGFFS